VSAADRLGRRRGHGGDEPAGAGFLRRDELRRDGDARGERRVRLAGWLVLGGLLAAALLAAAGADRFAWPGALGEEATYALQAASLAYDFDLAYDAGDRERFAERWRMRPEGLVLQRRPGGTGAAGAAEAAGADRAVFGRPFLYALVAAPFERLAPIRGPQVANALLLALAAVAAARALGRSMGAAAPLWVAALCFGSVAFGDVFRVTPDLFLMSAVAVGFALVYRQGGGGESGETGTVGELYRPPAAGGFRFALRWLAAGALLAVPAAWQPIYLVLLVPAALATPARRRGAGLAALAAGAAGLLLVTALVQRGAGGGWTAFEAPWPAILDLETGLDARLQGRNALYLLAGRHVGLLPYFLPLLLPLAVATGRRGRWALVPAALGALVALSLLRPFDAFGAGPAALGARAFLPLYPALWFVAGQPSKRPGRRALAAVAIAALAGPFLWEIWKAPRAYPLGPAGHPRWVAPLAADRLPFETTQETIPGPPAHDHRGLRLRFLNDAAAAGSGGALTLDGARRADLLIASAERIDSLVIEFERRAPSKIEVMGAELVESLFRGDGRVAFGLKLGAPRAVHPAPWREGDVDFYELRIRLPDAKPVPLSFTLSPGGWAGE
jgi:hypothetical protein